MRSLNQLNTKDSFSAKVSFSNSHKLLIGALALIFVAGMASPAFALTIDNFDTGSSLLSANNVTTTDGIINDPATITIGDVTTSNVTNIPKALREKITVILSTLLKHLLCVPVVQRSN